MAALFPACSRKNPAADAARPPLGVTKVTTGTGLTRGVDHSARSVEPDQKKIRVFSCGLVDCVRQDLDRDRVDDTIHIHGNNAALTAANHGNQQQENELWVALQPIITALMD